MDNDIFMLGGKSFKSRFLTGTGKYGSKEVMQRAITESGCEIVTVALRRVDFSAVQDNILNYIPKHVTLLPNTSGARTHQEAVRIARIARESGCGNFIKIEVINDNKYLMPDNDETIKATKILADEGFIVLPYMMPDITVTKKLEDAGAAAIMPLGSPIGSNLGLKTRHLIEMILENTTLPVIVDAGIGKPSHAAEAMEMGASAVLVNTAVAVSRDPVVIARAFSKAVEAGRASFLLSSRESGRYASPSSPLTGFLRNC